MYDKLLNEIIGISEDLYRGSSADYINKISDFLHYTMKKGETKNIKGVDVTKVDRNLWEIEGEKFTDVHSIADKIFQRDADELLRQEKTGLKVGDMVDSRQEFYGADEWDTGMKVVGALPFGEGSEEVVDVLVQKADEPMIRYQTSIQNIRKNQDV